MNWGSRMVWIGLLMVIALAAMAPPALAGKKPDLTITYSALRGPEYAFLDDTSSVITVRDTTTNEGKRAAGQSVTRVYLDRSNIDDPLQVASRNVPGVARDKSDRGTSRGDVEGVNLGAYNIGLCADADNDVKESNERNNCAVIRGQGGPRQFYVSKRRWSGSLSGFNTQTGREDWSSTDGMLQFREYLGVGSFDYGFVGSVTWTESGTDAGGCTWSGGGTQSFSGDNGGGSLNLNLDNEVYDASFGITSLFFPIHAQCGEFGFDSQGPKSFNLLATSNQLVELSPPRLAGTYNAAPQGWTWDFK